MADNKVTKQRKTKKNSKLVNNDDVNDVKIEISDSSNDLSNNNVNNIPLCQEINYDVNMTMNNNNKVKVEVKSQSHNSIKTEENDTDSSDDTDVKNKEYDKFEGDDGTEVLKNFLKPKVSPTYQQEIDKLEQLVSMIRRIPISDDIEKRAHVIGQLKDTLTIVLNQSKELINEMKKMSRRNSYLKNNISLAAFLLDKCKQDVPETDEEFDEMYN
tara:strand:- start:998 stop:1639 length:642 start_codon:yes stop_codon:yes gene_type:complete